MMVPKGCRQPSIVQHLSHGGRLLFGVDHMSDETADSGRFNELLAVAVAGGSTIRAAAESCGCSERQGYRIAATPEFKSRVSEIRSEMTSQAVGELSAAASEAVATMSVPARK